MKIRLLLALIFVASSTHAVKNPTGFITAAECLKDKKNSVNYVFENGESKEFVLSLYYGAVTDEGCIITRDGKILSDTQTYKRDPEAFLKSKSDLTSRLLFTDPSWFSNSLRIAVISSPGQQCYYHWLLQVLPRLKILAESKVDYDWIDVFGPNYGKPWQVSSLKSVMDHCGIPSHMIFIRDQEKSVAEAEVLIVPSVTWNPSSPDFWQKDLSWLKKFFADVFIKPTEEETPKRIFISRSKAAYRRIANEPALEAMLSAKGFATVSLEFHSVEQQATLFNNAEVIVGPHGAGWANLIFCKPETMIIEIDHGLPGEEQRSNFKGMAKRMGCIYNLFKVGCLEDAGRCEDTAGPLNQDMTVDVAAFKELCDELDI